MNLETFRNRVKIILVAEPGHEVFDDGLGPTAAFWVHTKGMAAFNRPELEMRHVPALWATDAVSKLNQLAAYSVDHEIKAGHNISLDGVFPVLVTAEESLNDHWTYHPLGAVTLSTLRAAVVCECPGCASRGIVPAAALKIIH